MCHLEEIERGEREIGRGRPPRYNNVTSLGRGAAHSERDVTSSSIEVEMKLKPEWKGGLPLTRGRKGPFQFHFATESERYILRKIFLCCFSLLYFLLQQCFLEMFSTASSAFPFFLPKVKQTRGRVAFLQRLRRKTPQRVSYYSSSLGRGPRATPVLSAIKRADCGWG